MTRTEFIIGLKNRLNLLSESECVDIIEEYTNHIDMKMQEGKSESDAINDFGNLDDLADEILAAYHIDKTKLQGTVQRTPTKTESKIKGKWSEFTDNIKSKTEKVKKSAAEKTGKIKEKSGEKVSDVKAAAEKSGGALKGFFARFINGLKKATNITGKATIKFSVIALRIMGLLCLWTPFAFVTITAVVCTVMAILLYFTTGIGFAGVCIAGIGRSIMCIGIMLWLTEIFSGGKAENA